MATRRRPKLTTEQQKKAVAKSKKEQEQPEDDQLIADDPEIEEQSDSEEESETESEQPSEEESETESEQPSEEEEEEESDEEESETVSEQSLEEEEEEDPTADVEVAEIPDETEQAVDDIEDAEDQAKKATRKNAGTAKDAKNAEKIEKVTETVTNLEDLIDSYDDFAPSFRRKARQIFENELERRVAEEKEILEQVYLEQLETDIVELEEQLAVKVNDYLDQVVSDWTDSNQIALESGFRLQVAEDFIEQIKDLFVENYIEVPESRVDVVAQLEESLDDSYQENQQLVEDNRTLNRKYEKLNSRHTNLIKETKRERFISSACDGLTVAQAERLQEQCSKNRFSHLDDEQFIQNVENVRSKLLSEERRFEKRLSKQIRGTKQQPILEATKSASDYNSEQPSQMDLYAQALSRIVKTAK